MKFSHFYFFLVIFLSSCPGEMRADGNKLQLVDAQFGRLFISPDSRDLLDKYKHSGLPPEFDQVPIVEKNQSGNPAQRSKAVTVSGVMITEGGKQRVWLQDNKHKEASQDSQLAKAGKTPDGSTKVLLHTQQRSRLLKPGQVWLLDEQRVKESYELKREEVYLDSSSSGVERDAKLPVEELPLEKIVEQPEKHEPPDS